MSFTYQASASPAAPFPALVRGGLPLILAFTIAGSAMAQGAPGGYGHEPGVEQGGGGMRHWGGGGGHRMISRETLEGPPAPAVLRDSIGLSGDQLNRYAQRYSNYTAETRPARDSLRTSMQAMRQAFENGDRSQARDRRDTLQKPAQALAKRDQDFEKMLKQDLSKDQQKRYDKWKEAREKADREHHRGGRRPATGNL